MATDPSQRAAEPLPSVNPSQLVKNLRTAEPVELSAVEAENRQRAASEIATIFELKGSRGFQWFEKEFIDKPYQEAFLKLRDPRQRAEGESLEVIQQTYFALRQVKSGMLEREIAHRKKMTPTDEEIPRLQEKLDSL